MSFLLDTMAKAAKNIIFSDLNTYYYWFKNIKWFVFNYFWQYFDLNGETIFIEAILSIKLVDKLSLTIIIIKKIAAYRT